MTPQQIKGLQKVRSKVCKALDIASKHSGTVAHEITLLTAQALAEIDAVLVLQPAPVNGVAGSENITPKSAQIDESIIRLK